MNKSNVEVALSVEGINKSYDKIQALDNVSFAVNKGEIFGLLGPNGAGKTTLLEILETLRIPDSGTAKIVGFDLLNDTNSIRSVIGVQLQSSSFFNELNLVDNVSLYADAYRIKVDPLQLLSEVDLSQKANSFYSKLSGGQKQRLAIAVALVNNPQILFLDEPTTGLDPNTRRSIWNLITRVRENQGVTIILTTHYMEEAEELCDRTAIIHKGKLQLMDTPDNLINNLLSKGFKSSRRVRRATLEDVFVDLTGETLIEIESE